MSDTQQSKVTAKHGPLAIRPVLACALALGIIGSWLWIVTRPTLVWYVSPPLDSHLTKIKVQIPRGWTVDVTRQLWQDPELSEIHAYPTPPARWLPNWIVRLLNIDKSPHNELKIQWWGVPGRSPELAYDAVDDRLTDFRWDHDNARGGWEMVYMRTNEAAFNSTHNVICGSLQIQ